MMPSRRSERPGDRGLRAMGITGLMAQGIDPYGTRKAPATSPAGASKRHCGVCAPSAPVPRSDSAS